MTKEIPVEFPVLLTMSSSRRKGRVKNLMTWKYDYSKFGEEVEVYSDMITINRVLLHDTLTRRTEIRLVFSSSNRDRVEVSQQPDDQDYDE